MNDLGDLYLLGTVFDFILILLFIVVYILYKNTLTTMVDKIKIAFMVIIVTFLSWVSFSVMVILVCLYVIKLFVNKSCSKKVKMSSTKKERFGKRLIL